ncbi:hypothetical protein KR018_000725, partial [Drosophila ironensis]
FIGTQPSDIAARLSTRYGNIEARTLMELRQPKPPTKSWKADSEKPMDWNNNFEAEAASSQWSRKKCICMRQPSAFECGKCRQFFRNRVAQTCEKHPSEVFLMDLRHCPYCEASIEYLAPAKLSWEAIRKFEDAPLPDDDD